VQDLCKAYSAEPPRNIHAAEFQTNQVFLAAATSIDMLLVAVIKWYYVIKRVEYYAYTRVIFSLHPVAGYCANFLAKTVI